MRCRADAQRRWWCTWCGKLRQKKRQAFFFEKKKQKTFATWPARLNPTWAAYAKEQEFFGSFFQKRTYFFLLKSPSAAPPNPA
jgi:hypothetical protein